MPKAVTTIRAPLATERQAGSVNAVVIVGDLHQAVHEDVQTAQNVVAGNGPHA
jgi:hypothetical protein